MNELRRLIGKTLIAIGLRIALGKHVEGMSHLYGVKSSGDVVDLTR